MKERPILFSGPMVRALLDGSKTQTRRVCKPAQFYSLSTVVEVPDPMERGQVYNGSHFGDEEGEVQFASPYGGPGDRLWVRESGAMHALLAPEDPLQPMLFRHDVPTTVNLGDYWVQRTRAPGASYSTECTREQFLRHSGAKVVPSIHMPRWASRITLEITSVRVERLQDISEADAKAEGITPHDVRQFWLFGASEARRASIYREAAVEPYRQLWESINGPGSWGANPWVWAIEFRKVTP